MGNGFFGMHQTHLHRSDDVIDVILAGAQIRVFHCFENAHQSVALCLECPFGIAQLFADEFNRSLGDGRVIEHQQMRIDECRDIGVGVRWNLFFDGAKVGAGAGDGFFESFDFSFDLGFLQGVLGNLHQATGNDVNLTDGNALGCANTVERKSHLTALITRPRRNDSGRAV